MFVSIVLWLIKKQGMTQSQLAEKLCISPELISMIKHGERSFTPQNAANLMKLYPTEAHRLATHFCAGCPVSMALNVPEEQVA